MIRSNAPDDLIITSHQARFTSWVAEVLVDIVVLNLFVEFSHSVVIDSFWVSVLTALLLKLSIDAVKRLEHRVGAYFKAKEGSAWRALGLLAVFTILFLSKFVILELVDIVFGEHVELGHIVEIIAIIFTMLAANGLLLLAYRKLGARQA